MREKAIGLSAGWYLLLNGKRVDLDDWVRTLNEPFDPVAFRDEDDAAMLSSDEFLPLAAAVEVRRIGVALVARLNGAMSVMHGADPVRLQNVVRVAPDGTREVYNFAEANNTLGRCTASATGTVSNADGTPVHVPPPTPSFAQTISELAEKDDQVDDLIRSLGRSDNWYDIYKTMEFAEAIVDGQRMLPEILGTSAKAYKTMRQTANFHRHARTPRPAVATPFHDALPLLRFIVRSVLDWRMAQQP